MAQDPHQIAASSAGGDVDAAAVNAANSTASCCRAEGNALFSQGEYLGALEAYTRGLRRRSDLGPGDSELWSNRAACFMKLGLPQLAAADAYSLLDARPDWPKTYFRLGKASVAMGGYSDALEWFNLGLTCASMLRMPNEEKTLQKCVRQVEKQLKKGKNLNAKLAEEMKMNSALFYVPQHRAPRDVTVASNQDFFKNLVQPFPVQVSDIRTNKEMASDDGAEHNKADVPGGGRGLFAAKAFESFSTVFLDKQIICVSYSPYLCDFCGAALPKPSQAFKAAKKKAEGVNTSCETYCSKTCLQTAAKCYYDHLPGPAAHAIANLRRDLYKGAESGEAPLASSYHVLGALRLAAMTLARREYLTSGKKVPSELQSRLDAFAKLVRPADLPREVLDNHGFKIPFAERYAQYQRICTCLGTKDLDLSFEWYDDAWGAMLFNALRSGPHSGVEDDPGIKRIAVSADGYRSQSVSIMAIGSYMNHSHAPNVTLRRCKVGSPFPTSTFQFVTLKTVAPGEELFLSYTDPALPMDVQRQILRSQYLIYGPEDEALGQEEKVEENTEKTAAATQKVQDNTLSSSATETKRKFKEKAKREAVAAPKKVRASVEEPVGKPVAAGPTIPRPTLGTAAPNPIPAPSNTKSAAKPNPALTGTSSASSPEAEEPLIDNVQAFNSGSLEDDLD